jgi:hypothetical protein
METMAGHDNQVHLPLLRKTHNLVLGRTLTDHDLLGSPVLSQTPSLLGKSFTGTAYPIVCRIDILRSDLFIRSIFREKLNDM